MPFKKDENGEEWYYFGEGDYLECDLATGEMIVKFSWWEWMKSKLSYYFIPQCHRFAWDHRFYENDPEWCDEVSSHTWLPIPMAEFAARIKLGRWNKELKEDEHGQD